MEENSALRIAFLAENLNKIRIPTYTHFIGKVNVNNTVWLWTSTGMCKALVMIRRFQLESINKSHSGTAACDWIGCE